MKEYLYMAKLMKNLAVSALKKQPILFGLDITNRCNLNCDDKCYFKIHRTNSEMSDQQVIELATEMRKKGASIGGYVGGEPMLRKSLLSKITPIMPLNVIITNGSQDTPYFSNSIIMVSVDGTKEIHDKLRSSSGLYQKIKKNFSHRKDVCLTTTLTNDNKEEVEPVLKEWVNTNVKGVFFDFATPFTNQKSDFWVNWDDRHRIIDQLINLKEKFGDFILLSEKSLNMLRKDTIDTYPENCSCAQDYSIHYKADGTLNDNCVLGQYADCTRCGVHIATFVPSLLSLDKGTINVFTRMLKNIE